jgi:hypothetical protein
VSPLSDNTLQELRAALTEQFKQATGPSPELTRLLRKVAAEARKKNVKPEELIVTFKQLWNSVAETLRLQNVEEQEHMRQTLVTLCIQAYYAEEQ